MICLLFITMPREPIIKKAAHYSQKALKSTASSLCSGLTISSTYTYIFIDLSRMESVSEKRIKNSNKNWNKKIMFLLLDL